MASKPRHRKLLGFSLLVFGLLVAAVGLAALSRPRTNLEDDISWIAMGLGVALLAAGVSLVLEARFVAVAVIAIASPFVAYVLLVALFWSVAILGSGRWSSEELRIRSGYTLIGEARQIDELFGPAWHSLVNYEAPNIMDWQSAALFGGRYELNMYVSVDLIRKRARS